MIAMEHDDMTGGTLLLETVYVYESASSSLLNTMRYLPPTTIRILVDDAGRLYETKLDHELINRHSSPVERETALSIVQLKFAELKHMVKLSEREAEKRAPRILHGAHLRAQQLLSGETARLRALQKVNRHVRDEEIHYFEQQLQALDGILSSASLRLDAIRVIICT